MALRSTLFRNSSGDEELRRLRREAEAGDDDALRHLAEAHGAIHGGVFGRLSPALDVLNKPARTPWFRLQHANAAALARLVLGQDVRAQTRAAWFLTPRSHRVAVIVGRHRLLPSGAPGKGLELREPVERADFVIGVARFGEGGPGGATKYLHPWGMHFSGALITGGSEAHEMRDWSAIGTSGSPTARQSPGRYSGRYFTSRPDNVGYSRVLADWAADPAKFAGPVAIEWHFVVGHEALRFYGEFGARLGGA